MAAETPSPDLARCLVLAGPTASGKTEVALALAGLLDGEIISADSMQVYRGMDIGTAKPAPAERQQVPHHLLDVVNVSDAFDAAAYLRLARAAAAQIQGRGKTPILCGGTGLYIKAFLHGLDPATASDPDLRARLEATPLPELLRELEEHDPVTFSRIDRQNPRRVVRAIEILRLSGVPPSRQRSGWAQPGPPTPAVVLAREPADLRARIDARVDAMFDAGLVAETERLLRQGLRENRTAGQALGYRQVIEHLRGERPLKETIALVKTRTWQFARRQMTWFRRQAGVTWIPVAPGEPGSAVAGRIAPFFPGQTVVR